MIKRIAFILFLSSSLVIESQNWDSIKGGIFSKQIERVLFDSIHNKLLVSSKFVNHVGNLSVRGVCSWDGVNWDSLGGGINTHDKWLNPNNPQGNIITCIPFQGKLLVGGYFSSIGYVNTTSLALWDGTKWDSLPKRAFRNGKSVVISGFLKKGNLLYITGSFDTIAGLPTTGIATWDGINFNPIILPIDPNFMGVTSIIEFQNEIYITGGMFMGGKGDILKYNGTNWISTTGGGFIGPYAGARQLIVYNNELYAAGYFEASNGNSGNNIIKWDGSQWHDVGFGTIGSYIEINKLLVYHNKLWAFGYIPKVANAFAGNVAVYDGATWCGLKDTLDNKISSAAIYNDTIYIGGGFWKANSDSIPYIAKLSDSNLFNQCVNVVGVSELLVNNQITVHPNPISSILNITDEQNKFQNATINIANYLGQIVFTSPFTSQIYLQHLSAGMYFLTVEDKERKQILKIVKE